MPTLTPVLRIKDKRKEKKRKKNKVQRKVKRNLGLNFVSLILLSGVQYEVHIWY